jgi:hypothetical protein
MEMEIINMIVANILEISSGKAGPSYQNIRLLTIDQLRRSR